MALRIIRKGNSGTSNDHNLLINKGIPDQHPIESISLLREELDRKYEIPDGGIPRKDLGFEVVTKEELQGEIFDLEVKIQNVNSDIIILGDRTTAVEDWINNIYPTLGGNGTSTDSTNFKGYIELYEEFIAQDKDKLFVLSKNYVPENNSLHVYLNGRLMRINDDYIEVDEYKIEFLYELDFGDYVCFISSGRTNINSPIHEEFEYAGDSTFVLKYRYNKGDNSLSVFHEGVRLLNKRDYDEVDEYTILIKKPLTINDSVVFRRETHMTSELKINDGHYYESKYNWTQIFKVENENFRKFTFSKEYVPGTETLQVFVNGMLQDVGDKDDYIEDTSKSITFNYNLEVGDLIKVTCTGGVFQWVETFVSAKDQTVFSLKNSYSVHSNDIEVYEDGILIQDGADYDERNQHTIVLLDKPEPGCKIKVFKRR